MGIFSKTGGLRRKKARPLFNKTKDEHDSGIFQKKHQKNSQYNSFEDTLVNFREISKKEVIRSYDDPLEILNSDQYAAATPTLGRNLIIASAGTGKTSTIVGRVSYLLNVKNIDADHILLLTFTSKAAQEMIERIEKFFGSEISKKITIGTFHSTSLKIVKLIKKGSILKLPNEASLVFKSIFEHRNIPMDENVAALSASTIYERYGSYINTTDMSIPFDEWFKGKWPDQSPYAHVYDHICTEFEETKHKERFYDFNDLLLITRDYYRKNNCGYLEVIVDEYQDTNILQSSLLDVMNPQSLYCVGDYDQSIYAFNGADIGIIGSFADRYRNANIKTLTKNYRSSRSILALAEKVIKNNPRLYPKKLEVMMKENPFDPTLKRPENQQEQAESIVHTVLRDQAYGETSIIYRSNSSGDVIEMHFKMNDIPYVRKGGQSFFDTKDMKCFISLYKLICGDSALTTFLQSLEISPVRPGLAKSIYHALEVFGHGKICNGAYAPDISKKNAAMSTKAENTKMGIVNIPIDPSKSHLKSSLSNSIVLEHPVFGYTNINDVQADILGKVFNLLSVSKVTNQMTPAELVSKIAESPALQSIYKYYASHFCRDSQGVVNTLQLDEFMKKLNNKLSVLLKIASKKKTHKAFISGIAVNNEIEENKNLVSLLSVHASKGLEFSNVHLIDLCEDVFPNTKLMNNGGGGIEEERRLFYVAVTRAKHKIVLYSPMMLKGKQSKPSRFLQEGGLLNNP